MKQEVAKTHILAEMSARLPSVPYEGADAGIAHFFALKNERPELFEFRFAGDQWQLVHVWMRQAGLVMQ